MVASTCASASRGSKRRRRPTSSALRTGRSMAGPFALDEVERYAERFKRQQQVREEDRGVDLDTVDGLQRHLGREFRLPADLQQGVPGADGAVLGHVAAGLPHEPDRGVVGRQAPAGAQEGVIHRALWYYPRHVGVRRRGLPAACADALPEILARRARLREHLRPAYVQRQAGRRAAPVVLVPHAARRTRGPAGARRGGDAGDRVEQSRSGVRLGDHAEGSAAAASARQPSRPVPIGPQAAASGAAGRKRRRGHARTRGRCGRRRAGGRGSRCRAARDAQRAVGNIP